MEWRDSGWLGSANMEMEKQKNAIERIVHWQVYVYSFIGYIILKWFLVHQWTFPTRYQILQRFVYRTPDRWTAKRIIFYTTKATVNMSLTHTHTKSRSFTILAQVANRCQLIEHAICQKRWKSIKCESSNNNKKK